MKRKESVESIINGHLRNSTFIVVRRFWSLKYFSESWYQINHQILLGTQAIFCVILTKIVFQIGFWLFVKMLIGMEPNFKYGEKKWNPTDCWLVGYRKYFGSVLCIFWITPSWSTSERGWRKNCSLLSINNNSWVIFRWDGPSETMMASAAA